MIPIALKRGGAAPQPPEERRLLSAPKESNAKSKTAREDATRPARLNLDQLAEFRILIVPAPGRSPRLNQGNQVRVRVRIGGVTHEDGGLAFQNRGRQPVMPVHHLVFAVLMNDPGNIVRDLRPLDGAARTSWGLVGEGAGGDTGRAGKISSAGRVRVTDVAIGWGVVDVARYHHAYGYRCDDPDGH